MVDNQTLWQVANTIYTADKKMEELPEYMFVISSDGEGHVTMTSPRLVQEEAT